jgi:hypothetical protein
VYRTNATKNAPLCGQGVWTISLEIYLADFAAATFLTAFFADFFGLLFRALL